MFSTSGSSDLSNGKEENNIGLLIFPLVLNGIAEEHCLCVFSFHFVEHVKIQFVQRDFVHGWHVGKIDFGLKTVTEGCGISNTASVLAIAVAVVRAFRHGCGSLRVIILASCDLL